MCLKILKKGLVVGLSGAQIQEEELAPSGHPLCG